MFLPFALYVYNNIQEFFLKKGFNININNEDYRTVIQLFLSEKLVGTIYGGHDNSAFIYKRYKTRNSECIIDKSININWISIENEFRRKGLGYLLLLFFMMYMYCKKPDFNYIILDDCSDNSCVIKGNLYAKFGFVSQDIVKPDNDLLNYSSYPEKQTTYSYLYKIRNNIEKNILKYQKDFL